MAPLHRNNPRNQARAPHVISDKQPCRLLPALTPRPPPHRGRSAAAVMLSSRATRACARQQSASVSVSPACRIRRGRGGDGGRRWCCSAAAAAPADAAIRLFKPSEILAADAADYQAYQPTKLITVMSDEAAEYFIRHEGYRKFDLHATCQTVPQAPAPPAPGAGGPVYLLPPPEGEVNTLPQMMPKLYEPKGDEPQRSVADIVVESFEIKVIDEDAKCVWHPICMWPTKAKDRRSSDIIMPPASIID